MLRPHRSHHVRFGGNVYCGNVYLGDGNIVIGAPCARPILWVAYALFVFCTTLTLSAAYGAPATGVAHPQVSSPQASSTFTIDLPTGIAADVFTLAAPYRVIVEAPDAQTLPLLPTQSLSALVRSTSVEPRAAGGARVVIETTSPVEVATAAWDQTSTSQSQPPQTARLLLTLKPTTAAAFGAGTGAGLTDALAQASSTDPAPPDLTATFVQATTNPVPVKPAVFDDIQPPDARPAPSKAKPIILIDPGHGGIDPGAVGPGKITEKTIVLAVATQLKAVLDANNRYDVRLTRTTDVFIPLDKRVALSKQVQADIFISLHADTIDNSSLARSVRGASVYTLSDKASNEEARIMAEKENAADLIAGLPHHATESGDDIKPILFDLMARETAVFSKLLSRSVVASLSHKKHPLAHEPERSAAFRVLRQSAAPSVLVELGFLSNPAEEQLMTQTAWQRQIATAIGAAVDTYFSRKANSTPTGPLGGSLGGLPP